MNLQKLFEIQAKLDKKIVEEKGLQGQDLLDKKILALQVELGELANEWRGFKFWSYDQEPRIEKRTYKTCPSCNGEYVDSCWMCGHSGQVVDKIINPLLEEFVDCLHFILSIGLELGLTNWKPSISSVAVHFGGNELITQFEEVFWYASSFGAYTENEKDTWYSMLFSNFLGLGKMLGFTWEQVEESYFEKNRINHERQKNGY